MKMSSKKKTLLEKEDADIDDNASLGIDDINAKEINADLHAHVDLDADSGSKSDDNSDNANNSIDKSGDDNHALKDTLPVDYVDDGIVGSSGVNDTGLVDAADVNYSEFVVEGISALGSDVDSSSDRYADNGTGDVHTSKTAISSRDFHKAAISHDDFQQASGINNADDIDEADLESDAEEIDALEKTPDAVDAALDAAEDTDLDEIADDVLLDSSNAAAEDVGSYDTHKYEAHKTMPPDDIHEAVTSDDAGDFISDAAAEAVIPDDTADGTDAKSGADAASREFITLAHGSGGKEMQDLIRSLGITERGIWDNCDDDSATLDIGGNQKLVFTTDTFTVDPLFFPGGDIGHIAVCGTLNDLAVMGATPLGISLAIVIEEGFSFSDLDRIISSVKAVSAEAKVPVVTGDTKVMGKGKIDKMIINTAGVGIIKSHDLLTKRPEPGDKVIISGGIGEHAVALLSKRFDYSTSIVTDAKPLLREINAVRHLIKVAKDPTRGGIASCLNELCEKYDIGVTINEQSVPAKKEVSTVAEMLGINLYELACEGRFVCICSKENADEVVRLLKWFNSDASIIGEVGGVAKKVVVKTMLGTRILPMPTGRIVPRIC